MRYAEYVLPGWGISLAVIGAYVAWVLRRGRRLSDEVPEDDRRWGGTS